MLLRYSMDSSVMRWKNPFSRIQYGGVPSGTQKVYFINLQEIKGIRFGTRTPINYFDQAYNAELFLRTHGTYSIEITDPLRFYAEAVPAKSGEGWRSRISTSNTSPNLWRLCRLQSIRCRQMGFAFLMYRQKGRELSRYMSSIRG